MGIKYFWLHSTIMTKYDWFIGKFCIVSNLTLCQIWSYTNFFFLFLSSVFLSSTYLNIHFSKTLSTLTENAKQFKIWACTKSFVAAIHIQKSFNNFLFSSFTEVAYADLNIIYSSVVIHAVFLIFQILVEW